MREVLHKRRCRGRPSRLTPETAGALCRAAERGVFLHEAAAIAGVSLRTVEDWIQRGEGRHPRRASRPEHAEFVRSLREAEGALVEKAVTTWSRHFERDWRACESFLRRRFPFTWGNLVARTAPPPEVEFDLEEPDSLAEERMA